MNHTTQLNKRELDVLSYWQELVKDANTKSLVDDWKVLFKDKESRYAYFNDFLDSYLSMQIKVLREQRGWTQSKLAEKADMKQERISVLEGMNYSAWSINVLRRLAEAYGLRLVVRFEDFGSYLKDYIEFDRIHLERRSYEDDVIFNLKQGNTKNKSKLLNGSKQPSSYAKTLIGEMTLTIAKESTEQTVIRMDAEDRQGLNGLTFSEDSNHNAVQFATS